MKDGAEPATINNLDEGRAKRKPRVLKKRRLPDDDSASSLDKKFKVEDDPTGPEQQPSILPPPNPPRAKRGVKPSSVPQVDSNEMDFGLHVGNLFSPLMTFESTVRALLKTLKYGAEIQLAENNISFCAECRGGGDLLCCDCCQFAFHVDCLDSLERGSYLHVPYQKYGMRRRSEPEEDMQSLILQEHEWFCPYCLSAPIRRHWKRGVPQFLRTFNGFDNSDISATEFQKSEGQLATWCDEVDSFVNDPESLNQMEAFTPSVLLALTGIRRAVQRLGPAFQIETRAEVERLEQEDFAHEVTSPSLVNDDVAEPVDVKDESARPKTTIMNSETKRLSNQEPNEQQPSDEAVSESDAAKTNVTRARRGRTRVKPIASNENQAIVDCGEAARMNVGGSFQVPSVHKYYTEALVLGCDYKIIDNYSVFARLPADSRSFVPQDCLPVKHSRRLMYSFSQLAQKQRSFNCLTDNDPSRMNTTTPLNPEELAMYIRRVLELWPAWIQWPASQEYALKILHHCRYDSGAALRLLCTDGMQFRTICDPPIRPYMNKWRPRDKRGLISTIPYPPPTPALIYAGVGEPSNT